MTCTGSETMVLGDPKVIMAMTTEELVCALETTWTKGQVLTPADYALAMLAGGIVEFEGPRIGPKRNYYVGHASRDPEVVEWLGRHMALIYASCLPASVPREDDDVIPSHDFAALGMPQAGRAWAKGFVRGWQGQSKVHLLEMFSVNRPQITGECPEGVTEIVLLDNCAARGSVKAPVIDTIRFRRRYHVRDCVVPFCRGEGAVERFSRMTGGPVRILAAVSIETAAPLWEQFGRDRGVPKGFATEAWRLRDRLVSTSQATEAV